MPRQTLLLLLLKTGPMTLWSDVLERYAIKSETEETGSKQLKTDGWKYDELIELLYEFSAV